MSRAGLHTGANDIRNLDIQSNYIFSIGMSLLHAIRSNNSQLKLHNFITRCCASGQNLPNE